MAIDCYLAMTAAEIHGNAALPPKLGWMACHFSPYGTGLCNLPRELPEGSMLILNDRTPIHGHDPRRIIGQLSEVLETLKCESLLLDFQRPEVAETAALTREIVGALPCPVAVSEPYAHELTCPVFLPPVPPDTRLRDHLAPWQGREIWLEAALDGLVRTLTDAGSAAAPLPPGESPEGGRRDEALHCHYTIRLTEAQAAFTLYRTPEDLTALLEEAAAHDVTRAVGLYQELWPLFGK